MAKKTKEEMAEIEYAALEEAMREMMALQDAEDDETSVLPGLFSALTAAPAPEEAPAAPAEEAPVEEAAAKTPVKKTARKTAAGKAPTKKAPAKRGAAKKAADGKEAKAAKKAPAVRRPRKKAFTPNFVIQNTASEEITYESIVEKVQTAITAADVQSIDIYVKAEERKAYYVVNGEAAGAVDLF